MADLNRELKEYLSRNNESKENLLPTNIKDLKLPKLSSWFVPNGSAKSANDEETGASPTATQASSSWFSSTKSESLFPSLGRKQRIMGFILCVVMGIICFSLSALYAPLLLLKARKFALLFTLGSLFSLLSFSFLWGPVNHLKHLFSSERLMFTSVYLMSLMGTLYSALSLQSTALTSVAAVIQV
ncbi:Vesicle transport protein Got1/SFT2-like [Trinorchestia longiramus]|nr:Vesicle transport protein Got1/SFT2-like [Trinorchestia longiramus]